MTQVYYYHPPLQSLAKIESELITNRVEINPKNCRNNSSRTYITVPQINVKETYKIYAKVFSILFQDNLTPLRSCFSKPNIRF